MFTVKFYTGGNSRYRQVLKQAESLTILHGDDGSAEITLHQENPKKDQRIDINDGSLKRAEGWPPCFESAIILDGAGRTVEIIGAARNRPTTTYDPQIVISKGILPDGNVVSTTGFVQPAQD